LHVRESTVIVACQKHYTCLYTPESLSSSPRCMSTSIVIVACPRVQSYLHVRDTIHDYTCQRVSRMQLSQYTSESLSYSHRCMSKEDLVPSAECLARSVLENLFVLQHMRVGVSSPLYASYLTVSFLTIGQHKPLSVSRTVIVACQSLFPTSKSSCAAASF